MTPEEAKASLGVATNLVDNFLMSQQEMGKGEAVGQQMDTGQPQAGGRSTEGQPEQPEQSEDKSMLEDIKKTIQSEIKKEISGLRELIEEALNEEEDSENKDSKDKEDAED